MPESAPLRSRLHDDVLVVVPCLNEARNLPRLLDFLDLDAPGALIVVVDAGSTDASRRLVEARARSNARVLLLDNPKRIQSAGVNLAVRYHGEGRRWLLRIDAHAEYPAGFVDRLKATALARAADAVVVPMISQGTGCFQKAAAAAQNSVLGTGGSPHRHLGEGRWVEHGHHALMSMDRFKAAGGYDESFACNEDAELDRRQIRAGARIWLEPGAAIVYHPRAALVPLWRQYLGYGRGRARNLARHREGLRLRQVLPLAVAPSLALAFAGMMLSLLLPAPSPLVPLLALPAGVWLGLTLLAGASLGVKARCRCAMGSGLAAATMHAAWSIGFLIEWNFGSAPGPAPLPLASLSKKRSREEGTGATHEQITICICTYRRESLFATLESCRQLARHGKRALRVLVIDNDEEAALEGRIGAFADGYPIPLAYLHAPARNISIARNAALDAVETRWAALIDDDEIADPDWLDRLMDARRGHEVVVGQSLAVYPGNLPGWVRRCDFHSNRIEGSVANAYTSNVLIDVEAVRATRVRFREDLGRTGGEDTMFFRALARAGLRMTYCPESIVYEKVPDQRATMTWIQRRKYRSGQVHGLVCREFEPGAFRWLLATATAKMTVCVTMALLTGPGTDRSRRWMARAWLHAGALDFRLRPRILEEYA